MTVRTGKRLDAEPAGTRRARVTVRDGGARNASGREVPAGPGSHQSKAGTTELILVTDGVSARFADRLDSTAVPQQIADRILREHAKGTDDALVLVARYEGGAP